jgi:hypothetical protein
MHRRTKLGAALSAIGVVLLSLAVSTGAAQAQGDVCPDGFVNDYRPCLPDVEDLNCPDLGGSVQVVLGDPYGLDGDDDGIGCEGPTTQIGVPAQPITTTTTTAAPTTTTTAAPAAAQQTTTTAAPATTTASPVVVAPPTESLPPTGSDTTIPLASISLAMIVTGAAFVVTGRRQSRLA